MLKQASVLQIRHGEITRGDGFVAITMRFYPRGLKKELRDEYLGALAPDKDLFRDFKHWQKRLGHEAGFARSRYDARFSLSSGALTQLQRLSEISRTRDVYLVCQCDVGERCHREMLMLLAKKKFKAKIGPIHNSYSRTRLLRS